MSDKLSLLFLCHRIPYPPEKGEKIRAWHIFEHLARRYRVHLGCFLDDPADEEHVGFLQSMCQELLCVRLDKRRQKLRALLGIRPSLPLTLNYYRNAEMQNWVNKKLADPEIVRVFVFSSGMAGYVMDSIRPDMILDMVDVDSEKWREYACRVGGVARLIWAREARTLLRFERQATRHFARTLFVSRDEYQRFVMLAPESRKKVEWVENGVDLEKFSLEQKFHNPFTGPAKHIVFTGTMDYWPNVDAVTWFAREVLPKLRRRSNAEQPQFCVVGANPTAEVRSLAKHGTMVTGRVADVRPYLAHAAVAVTPLRLARGIQNKVLEAMAMGTPVIASPQAFEGVRVEPGRDLLVADGAEEMAQAIDAVLDGKYPGLGPAGRRAVESCYAWSATLRRLDDLLTALWPEYRDSPRTTKRESRI